MWRDKKESRKGNRLVKENFKGRGLYIYENKNCLPRFFLVNQIKVFENSNQLLNALSEVDVEYLKNNLLIEKEYSQNLITMIWKIVPEK